MHMNKDNKYIYCNNSWGGVTGVRVKIGVKFYYNKTLRTVHQLQKQTGEKQIKAKDHNNFLSTSANHIHSKTNIIQLQFRFKNQQINKIYDTAHQG